MNGSFSVSAWVCWMLLLANAAAWAQEDDPALRARFLKGVRQTARKLDRISFHARCVNTHDYAAITEKKRAELRIDPDKPDIREFECAIRGPFTWESARRRDGIEYVMAKNDKYAFQVARSAAVESYSLGFVEELGADRAADARIEKADVQARGLPLGAWYILLHPVSHFVESPWFKIKRVFAVQSEGEDLVRVDFDHLIDDPDRKLERLSDAFMVCDPARGWAMKEYGGTVWHGAVRHVTIESGEMVDGFPIPSRITVLTPLLDDPKTIYRVVTTVEVMRRDVPKEEFYLSHYGLPEPKFRRSWLGAWVSYLIAGIVCLGVGRMILKWRRA